MDRLADQLELLDGPLDDPVALVANLRDLARINRWFGGIRLSRQALDALLGTSTERRPGPITLLDVGTGGADIPVALQAIGRRRGQLLEVVALDSRPEVVDAALSLSPSLATRPGFRFEVGDGRSLPGADGSQDVVHASLVLHHLEPGEAVALLHEMGRVARLGIIVNDLARGRLAWLGAWVLGRTLTRGRFTRNDAPLSVRRAYTRAEMGALLGRAGLEPIASFRGAFGHRYAIAAVRRPGEEPVG